MTNNAKSLSTVLGQQMLAVRDAEGLRQDELARKARRLGLHWGRGTVAAIETGRREVHVGELVLLPHLLGRTLPQLLAGVTEWVRVGPDAAYSPEALRGVLSGGWGDGPIDTPVTRPLRQALAGGATFEASLAATAAYVAQMEAVWPAAGIEDYVEAEQDAKEEVCERAAQRLGVESVYLAAAARRTWGHSLTAERDARSPEGVRSRGHITRALIAELVPLLEEAGVIRRQASTDENRS